MQIRHIVGLVGLMGLVACTDGSIDDGSVPLSDTGKPGISPNQPAGEPGSPSPSDPGATPGSPTPSVPGSTPTDPGVTPGTPTDPTAPGDPTTPVPPASIPPGQTPEQACATRTVAEQPLRRLSAAQYQNVIRDLFGSELAQPLVEGSLFPRTQITMGFVNDAEANLVNVSESNAIEDNAERIAGIIAEEPAQYLRALLPCTLPQTIDDAAVDACIDDFIDDFGLKAFRRPITDAETAIARGIYDTIRAEQSAELSWSSVVQYFVQAPALLYRVERGGEKVAAGMVRLTGTELATRLSFLFTDGPPDQTLLDAANANQLTTPEQIEAQSLRLLDSPRFREVLASFHHDWLHIYELENSPKDETLFPEYTAEARSSLLEETGRFVDHVLDNGDGSIRSLLTSNQVPVNGALANLYGVSRTTSNAQTWEPVVIPDRKGILTLASTMATLAKSDRTNPIHRGAFVRRQVLCQQIPSLPGDVDTMGPLKDTSGLPTARERLSPLLENAQCKGCHTIFNPIGLAFESYDAVGRYRTEEKGVAIDTSGEIDLGAGVQPFTSPTELVDLLAGNEAISQCYALQWYRATMGRLEVAADACSVATLNQAVADSGGNIREILLTLAQTDGFLYKSEVTQ